MDLGTLAAAWRDRLSRRKVRLQADATAVSALAREAAAVLRERCGASEVWLFGSLATGVRHEDFDVDLAVRGIAPERWYAALSAASDIVGRPVDLVDLDSCPDTLARRVSASGVRLDG